jgi:hypothetical protein
VGQWLDKSGKARHATQTDGTKKPALKLSGKNSRNILQFDGSNDFLSISGSASSLKFLHSTDSTVFIVFKYTTLNNGGLFDSIDGSSSGTGLFLYATSAGSLILLIGRSSGSASTSTVSNASASSHIPADFVLLSLVNNPANATPSQRSFVYKNGGNLFSNNTASGVASNANATRDLMIGAFNPGTATLNGFICELIVYNSALSETSRTLVETYLNSKWSIY